MTIESIYLAWARGTWRGPSAQNVLLKATIPQQNATGEIRTSL